MKDKTLIIATKIVTITNVMVMRIINMNICQMIKIIAKITKIIKTKQHKVLQVLFLNFLPHHKINSIIKILFKTTKIIVAIIIHHPNLPMLVILNNLKKIKYF